MGIKTVTALSFTVTACALFCMRPQSHVPKDLRDAPNDSTALGQLGGTNTPGDFLVPAVPAAADGRLGTKPRKTQDKNPSPENELEGFCRDTDTNGSPLTTRTKHAHYRTTYNGREIHVHYIGTAHTGSPGYYDGIRDILSGADIVIVEGVLPSGFYGPPYLSPYFYDAEFDSQPERILQTKRRLYSIGRELKKNKAANKKYPDSLQELNFLRGLELYDAWGNLFIYTRDFNVISLGPAGKLDRENESANLSLKDGLAPPESTIFSANQDTNDEYFHELKKLYPDIAHQTGRLDHFSSRTRLLVADVSEDLLSPDDVPKINKYLKLRDQLPTLVLEQVIVKNTASPLTIGMHYGCAHGKMMDQRIKQLLNRVSGEKAEASYEWLSVFGTAEKKE